MTTQKDICGRVPSIFSVYRTQRLCRPFGNARRAKAFPARLTLYIGMILAPLHLLGRLVLTDRSVIEVRWCRVTKQILVTRGSMQWLCSDRESIAITLGSMLGISTNHLQVLGLTTFYNFDFSEGRPADDELVYNFMRCDWSDYAYDHLCFQGMLMVS